MLSVFPEVVADEQVYHQSPTLYAAMQFRNQKRRVRGQATLFFRREVVVGLNQQRSTVGWKQETLER